MWKKDSKGFTLIELMIVVAIVGVIAAIAIPSYTSAQAKARRTDAQSVLTSGASRMERWYAENGSSYLGAGTTDTNGDGIGDTGAPTKFATQSPVEGSTKFYNITISAVTASSYTLRATPIAGSSQASNGILELDSTGAKRWDKDNNGSFASTESTWY
ncbi:MAG: prepilin-type N-terminal cleavage/methylation domain-containing protein [Magnetococcales bacterium]|nr:prepilin-type N-terminal cleavage/methylation domain-containing protein [Magnetococcales bacterium]NGZ25478.1 prepilin-type N-terminal cleavage/methylation domain-containing protein [Magnetococcales bacterium]